MKVVSKWNTYHICMIFTWKLIEMKQTVIFRLFLLFLFLLLVCFLWFLIPLISSKEQEVLKNSVGQIIILLDRQTWMLWQMLTALFIAGSLRRSSEESPGAVVFMATFARFSFGFGWSGSWYNKWIRRSKNPTYSPWNSSCFLRQLKDNNSSSLIIWD